MVTKMKIISKYLCGMFLLIPLCSCQNLDYAVTVENVSDKKIYLHEFDLYKSKSFSKHGGSVFTNKNGSTIVA